MNLHTLEYGGVDCKSCVTSANTVIRPIKLLDILCFNKTAGVLYIMYFDNVNVAPATNTVPTAPWGITFAVQSGLGGTLGRCLDISGGIICWSSTPNTFTAVAANSGIITAVIKA